MKMRLPGIKLPSKGRALAWRFVDIVGDVHGCLPELQSLLIQLGYVEGDDTAWRHPGGRRLVFVGDLCNRGPDTPGVLDLVSATVRAGSAIVVLGNHDRHVLRWLRGKMDASDDDLAATASAYAAIPKREREDRLLVHRRLLKKAPLWVLLDPQDGSWGTGGHHDDSDDKMLAFGRSAIDRAGLVVAHAAWRPEILGAAKKRARRWCLYGPTLKRNETGRRPRLDWTSAYPGTAPPCIHGHTAFDGAVLWRGRTLCIDTGCAYGGALTALRWPARSIEHVSARQTYFRHLDLRPRPHLIDPRAEGLDERAVDLAQGARLR